MQYNHEEGRFSPLLAEDWSITGNQIRFRIKDTAMFSDGSPITANDVVASIKRLIIKRTATHFPVWEYFENCDSVKSMADHCSGINITDAHNVIFTLHKPVESFFLLMASPEGGIWSEKDIDMTSLEINPTKYSGPYILNEIRENFLKLTKNSYSPIQKHFLNSPSQIISYSSTGDELQTLIKDKKIDVYIESIKPFLSGPYEEWGLKREVSVFSSILYLSRVGTHKKHFGKDFFDKLWVRSNFNDEMTAADTFLPFGSLGALDKKSFYEELPDHSTSKEIKIAFLSSYFSEPLRNIIIEAGKQSGVKIIPVLTDIKETMSIIGSDIDNAKYDFVMAPYVASERFPSVQLKFLLDGRKPPFELENLDLPNASVERKKDLEKLQRWMINTQTVLPLFFTRNQIIYKEGISLGNQPISDSEIQLWRVEKGN